MSASNPKTSTTENAMERELVITRVFDAPRELVFRAWTDPKHMARWWGPKHFTNRVEQMDVRPGGAWRIIMCAPDGAEHPSQGVYREILPPERLVFTNTAVDKDGKVIIDGFTTVTFADQNGKTKLTLETRGVAKVDYAANYLKGMEAGWTQSLERLGESLLANRADREIAITRVFDAPRDLVWKAVTESGRLAQWWGPKGFTMLVCDVDLRPGGVFRYAMRSPDGHDMWGKWVYREIVPPERLSSVVSFTDEQGNILRHPASPTWPLEVLNTMTLSKQDGKTTMTISGYPINATEEERTTYEAGRGSMKQGFKGTLDQLEVYLAKAEQ
jgi:uncharacterized protein YndB with AHSA1/START domain